MYWFGLMQNVRNPRSHCGGIAVDRRAQRRGAVVVGEGRAHPADELELRRVAAGRRQPLAQHAQVLVARRTRAGGSRARSATRRRRSRGCTDSPPSQSRGPSGRHAFGSSHTSSERVVLAREARGRVPPERLPRGEVLVEQPPSALERHAECLVLLAVPAHGRLHDQSPLGEEVERPELAREQERMPQRREHGERAEPDPRRRCGDRREQDERAGPRQSRDPGSRAARTRAGSPCSPPAPALGPSTTCSLTITTSNPACLGDDGHLDERAQVARRDDRPVLREDEHELRFVAHGSETGVLEDLQGLEVAVEVERVLAALAADAGDPDAAERCREVADEERVHPHDPGAHCPSDPLGALGRAGVDDRREPVARRVRECDRLLLVAERLEGQHRPEHLALDDLALVRARDDERRLDEEPALGPTGARRGRSRRRSPARARRSRARGRRARDGSSARPWSRRRAGRRARARR